MSQEIPMQPRLYAEGAGVPGDEETAARIARLKNLQDRIARRPGIYLHVFDELGDSATDEVLEVHDSATAVRNMNPSPREHIQEYFSKRDDLEFNLDEASDDSIFSEKDILEAIQESKEKRSLLMRKGVMGSYLEENPEAREASNKVRRLIFGRYLARAVLWNTQLIDKREQRAG